MPNDWTAEMVLMRYPNCDVVDAPEVARLIREARVLRREDTGEKLSVSEAMDIYRMAIRIAGA